LTESKIVMFVDLLNYANKSVSFKQKTAIRTIISLQQNICLTLFAAFGLVSYFYLIDHNKIQNLFFLQKVELVHGM